MSYASAPPPPLAAVDPLLQGKQHDLIDAQENPEKQTKEDGKAVVDWLNLPCPVSYDEIQREVMSKCYSSLNVFL